MLVWMVESRGNALPVETFTGETTTLRFEDWLPTLERASIWDQWDETEQLLQLAGHLKGRAFQEWNLLTASKRSTYQSATESLKSRLDTGSRLLAAQGFRYAVQKDVELVVDFICRLEHLFQIAHGHEQLSAETRETFLYSQLQEGLQYKIISSPSVSGAVTYKALCVTAKQEEKRMAGLLRR